MDARRYASLTGQDRARHGQDLGLEPGRHRDALREATRPRDAFDRFLDTAYPPFWNRELDIEDVAVIETVLARADIETEGFADYARAEGRALHDDLNARAFDAGVFGVPTFLVEDEAWFGREHLPRVAWILGGRVGPPPLMMNRSFAS